MQEREMWKDTTEGIDFKKNVTRNVSRGYVPSTAREVQDFLEFS